MKQKCFALLLCLLLLPSLVPIGLAAEAPPLVVDLADLLTAEEETILAKAAQALQSEFQMDVVILTVEGLGGATPQDYADDYFDYNGYGRDAGGVLFLLSMEERDWYISTYGDAVYALTDYGIQQIAEAALPYFSDGGYFHGFDVFLSELPFYFTALMKDTPVDGYADYSGDYYHGEQESVVYYDTPESPSLLLSLAIGMAAGGITVAIMAFTMNTKRRQASAQAYLTSGSFHLQTRQDIFLYSNISKTRKQESSSESGGGGSSVHRSSSGRSHGGGGGKF